MSAKPSVHGVAVSVLLLIVLLIMLPVGYLNHVMIMSVYDDPIGTANLPTQASANNLGKFMGDWVYMDLAKPPVPGEERWPIHWEPDQEWTPVGLPDALVDSVNIILGRYSKALLDLDHEYVDRPVAIDMMTKGFPYIFYFQSGDSRENFHFQGNVVPRDFYYETLIPREYDAYMHGHTSHWLLQNWQRRGIVEVRFVPQDTTVAPIMLDPFTEVSAEKVESGRLASQFVTSTNVSGPAGEFTIRVLALGDKTMPTAFRIMAMVLLVIWLTAVIATVVMMLRIRRQNREIVALNDPAT
jgi:hypothetical protein